MNQQTKNAILFTTVIAAASSSAFAQGDPETPAAEKKYPWKYSAGFSLAVTSGNSDTLLTSGDFTAERKAENSEMFGGISAVYGKAEGVKNNDKVNGFFQYNWPFGDADRWYGLGRLEGTYDSIADIDYRYTASVGLGYYAIKSETTSLSFEVGPSYVLEKRAGVEDDYAALRAGEKFTHDFNEKTRVWQSLDIVPRVEDFADYVLNAEVGIETDLAQSLQLRMYVQDTYYSEPAPGRDGNDIKLFAGIKYKF